MNSQSDKHQFFVLNPLLRQLNSIKYNIITLSMNINDQSSFIRDIKNNVDKYDFISKDN